MWPWRSMLTAPGFGSSFGTRASGSVQRSRATCSSAFARATAAPRASTAALASASGSCVTWSSCTAGRSQPRAEARISDSTFTVNLPLRAAHPHASEAPAVTTTAPILRGIKVLVVDDDLLALDFIRTTLERFGATVATAASAREAQDRFTKQPPDVLVSDLLMPGEDGLDLIRKIRALEASTGRHTPAAALTALARSDDRRRALSAGFEMHVAKPVDPLELASAVEQLVHQ